MMILRVRWIFGGNEFLCDGNMSMDLEQGLVTHHLAFLEKVEIFLAHIATSVRVRC